MLSKIMSYSLNGIKGYLVDVEVDIYRGQPRFDIVGLPDAAVKESKERVRSAIRNSGFYYPMEVITANLAPADTKKEGAVFDLALAVGILCATEQLDYKSCEGTIFLGELSLTGEVRHINGILPLLISALENKHKRVVIPKANCAEASYIKGLEVYAVSTLAELVAFLKGNAALVPIESKDILENIKHSKFSFDLKFVMGQYKAKRALEIAACGGHNMLMFGPPGSGKTMLARCLASILPSMTAEEALECTKIYSVAGMLDAHEGLVSTRPFRSPHHTASRVSLTGGGAKARPGEISLAHNGVLFLDELPEYSRNTLEILRQPIEDGVITISRTLRIVEYPARFILIASMNPCPCGNYGASNQVCKCTPMAIAKYAAKLSGPLMDRIDLHIDVDSVKYDDLRTTALAEPSDTVRERVERARAIQTERFKGTKVHCNADMSTEQVLQFCKLDKACSDLIGYAFEKFRLSARAYNRILKVARTIADLDNSIDINKEHISEAIGYRSFDKKLKI